MILFSLISELKYIVCFDYRVIANAVDVIAIAVESNNNAERIIFRLSLLFKEKIWSKENRMKLIE